MNSILDFFDGVLDFTKTLDSFKRVCENLDSPDINWKSWYARNFVSKFVEAKNELVKRCPIHGYEDEEIDDMDDDMDDSEEESSIDEEEEEEEEEEEDDDEEEEEEETAVDESVDMGQCCCESIFQPMESFYRNKSFRKMVQEEEDNWAELNPKFDDALSNLKNIQPLIENVTRNGVENLSSLDIKLILNLIQNFEFYTDKTEEELENFFQYSYAKLIDSDVSLNEKRRLMSKPHLGKKVLKFLYIMQGWLYRPMDVTTTSQIQKGNGLNSIAKSLHEQDLDSTLNMTKDAMVGNDLADRF